jgi:hypothetical protein
MSSVSIDDLLRPVGCFVCIVDSSASWPENWPLLFANFCSATKRSGKRPGRDLRFSRSANRQQYAANQKGEERGAFEGFAQRIPESRAEQGFAHAFLRNSV